MSGRRDKLDESIIGTPPELAPDPVVETSTPKSTSFVAGYDRDINEYIEVTIENNTSSAATEDITVALHDGSSTSDPAVSFPTISNPQTKSSGSVASGGSTTVSFLTERVPLDAGDYTVDVSQSGSTLSITQTKVDTTAAVFVTRESGTGEFQIVDQDDSLVADTGPIGGSLGSGSDGTAISPTSVNNEAYAREFSGGDLSAKLSNALDYLSANAGDQGRVRITPKDDGTAWQWTGDLVIDPKSDFKAGVHIEVDHNVEIEYPGSGWPLIVTTGGEYKKSDPAPFVLTGGQWFATGDAQGWCQLLDIGGCIIDPYNVSFDGGTNAPVKGIELRNQDRWSETNSLLPSGGTVRSDYCIDFVGATYNPDSTSGGTDSFQGNYIGPCSLDTDEAGIRMRGNMQYCLFESPQIFLFDDGAVGFEFNADTRMWGLTISGGKTEEHASNTSSFRFGPDFDGFFNSPTLHGGFYEHPTNMVVADAGASNTQIFNAVALKNGYEIRAYYPGGTAKATFGRDGDGLGLGLKNLEAGSITDASSGNSYDVETLATDTDTQLDPASTDLNQFSSGSATSGTVPSADGSGNVTWSLDNEGEPRFSESGTIAAGTAGQIIALPVPDGQTLAVSEAALGIKNSSDLPDPPPTGLDLSILINDSGTAVQGEKILQGDGTTSSASGSGSPLASFANSSGETKMVAIIVDNGGVDSNTGTSSSQDTTTNGSYTIS